MFSINKFFSKNLSRHESLYLILIGLLTAIASEIKVIPFNGEALRFGLGSITFLLFLLIRPPSSIIRTGLATGFIVVCIRVFGGVFVLHMDLFISLTTHAPAFLFYFLYALGFHFIQIDKYKSYPLRLGAVAAGLELLSNSAEHVTRSLLVSSVEFTFLEWVILGGVALLRSYFVIGLYSSIIISEQKKRVEETLNLGSELYAESLYLQKSMNHIEKITASSHELYRKLKKEELRELSIQALLIAQEIHEVKKDSQQIYAGLSKLTNEKRNAQFYLTDLMDYVVNANEKYSAFLKKKITFHLEMSTNIKTDQQVALLALLNNITANAVEAIEYKGDIVLNVFEEQDKTYFVIQDTGKGITKEELSIVFEPGYTTKFNEQGVAATGIGLSHVQEIIQTLKGRIEIETPGKGTIFRVEIPTDCIRK